MSRGYMFSPELLKMMLSEERQKFVSALGRGASWIQLNLIRKNIRQINNLLESVDDVRSDREPDNRNPRQ